MPTLFDTHSFDSGKPGPRLVVLGAVHGNETCGTRAIERAIGELSRAALRIVAGSLTLVPITNRMAYDKGERSGDRNLNRNMAVRDDPRDNEDRIANELCPLLAAHEVLLDLHSFHSAGRPFVMVGPDDNTGQLEPFSQSAREEALALRLGVDRAVDGWLDTYAAGAGRRGGSAIYGIGTTEFMRSVGGWGLTLECGQHEDPMAPEVGYRALMNTLAHLRMIDQPDPPPAAVMEMLRLREVVDRAHAGDSLARDWSSFDAVRRDDVIGTRHGGAPVRAPADGFVVFPNKRAEPGSEWFYFATAHSRLGR